MINNKNRFHKIINYINYLFIFVLLYLIIKSGHKIYTTDDVYTKIYYSIYIKIFFGLIFLKLLFLFFNYQLKKLYLVYFGWIILFLFVFEIYLNIDYNRKININNYDPNIMVNENLNDKIKSYKIATGKDYDLRKKHEFFKDFKKKEKNSSIVLPFTETSKIKEGNLLPLSMKSSSYVIDCNENGYYSVNYSDRYGFNNPDNAWDTQNIDYLILGDSMTYGSCVNRPDDIASVLRKVSKKNILNLSVPGSGPLLQLAVLKEYFPRNVKNILFFFYEGNDIFNMLDESKNVNLKKYLEKDYNQNLKNSVIEVNAIINQLVNKIYLNYLNQKKDKIINNQNNINNISNEYKVIDFFKLYKVRERIILSHALLVLFEKILNQINNIAEESGTNLYIIFLPDAKTQIDSIKPSFLRKNIKKFSEDNNIIFIDIFEKIWRQEKNYLDLFPFNTIGSGHYSHEGYKIVANKLNEILN